jgi:TfoX/Sxy family transcriptional regulator of competence genes
MAHNEELAERIRGGLKLQRGVVEKKMFGGIGFMVNGNLACGVNKQDLILRLSDDDFENALKKAHVRIFDMAGRPMKGWVMVSSEGYKSDKALLSWIEKGIDFAQTLPHK